MMNQRPRMIFHAPFQLGKHRSQSASGIRPQKMLQAFRDIGYEVFEITGTVRERKESISRMKEMLRRGDKFDFLYSESTTKPQVFTGRYRWPLNPFFDFSFFRFCKRNKIPTSLFYRDVYWRFPEQREEVGWLKSNVLKPFYLWDLLNYNSALSVLYVPSKGYGDYLPIVKRNKIKLLPPGAEIIDSPKREPGNNLFYVGGLGPHYSMQAAFAAVKDNPQYSLTVCTRQEEWHQVAERYPTAPNIEVVHTSGKGLSPLYENADYSLMYMQTTKYRGFAVPFKLYEYLGRAKPIIASAGTYAGNIVTELGIGWTIPYDAHSLSELLEHLAQHPDEYQEVLSRMYENRHEHTWLNRAKQVQAELSGRKG